MKLNEKEIIKRLEECDNYDIEDAHIKADEILCECLEELGYKKIVEAFKELSKWYA